MAWLTLTTWSTGNVPSATAFNNIGLDIRTWGGNVDAAGYLLTNCGGVNGPTGANPLLFSVNGAERLRVQSNGSLMVASSHATRPAVGTSRVDGEISAYATSPGLASDAGFMRLSGGGGTTPNFKTYIDISGYSADADLESTIVFGTRSAERLRITATGGFKLGVLPTAYANNAAAIAGGLTQGHVYRTGGDPDLLCVVH